MQSEQNTLIAKIQTAIGRLGITQIYTLGHSGYDGHPDHKATHRAAIEAAVSLETAKAPIVMALSAEHTGALAVSGDVQRKLAAMACHASQFALDEQFWQDFKQYTPLVWGQETYDIYAS